MISGEKMNDLTLELQILAYTDIKKAQPFARMAFTNRSIFLLDQRSLCTLYMDSGKTKNPPWEIQKLLDECLLITVSDNGYFIGGITTEGNIFLWDKENDIHRIVSGMLMLASYHDRRFFSDAGLSLPYLCIGDTGLNLLVVNSNFQLFLWEASDINRNYGAYGPDKKLLRKADSKGLLSGGWSLISQPPEIKMPSFGDHEACIHSVFVQNSSTCGYHCLCSIVFYDSGSNLVVSTLKILFDHRRSSFTGASRFEAVWKMQAHFLTSILPSGQSHETTQPIKEIGALLIKHSKDGQIIAVSLNRESPKSHVVFLSSNHALFLGRADIQSNATIGSSNRHHWVVSMEWTFNDLFLVCLTGLGCAHLITRLGGPVMCLTKGFDFSPRPMRCLPLHPLISFSDGSMVTSSANSMPQQFSLAVHPNSSTFLCSDGYSVSAIQIMTTHTCLSLMQEISNATSTFFRIVEKKFSTRMDRKEGLFGESKARKLLGGGIPCEPPFSSEVTEVFKFETTPIGLQSDVQISPVGARNKSSNFPDSGKVEFAGINSEANEDRTKELKTLNDYLNLLEERCVLGWTLASSHAGLWTLEHEMVMQRIIENLVGTMHLMITHGAALTPPADQTPSSSPIEGRARIQSLFSQDRKFNPGLARAIALLERLFKILKLNCNNVNKSIGIRRNASAGSLISCSLLLIHWLVQAILASPSKRSKVHSLNGCYKLIDATEKNLMETFLSSSDLFVVKEIKAEPCSVFSFDKPDPMFAIGEVEEEEETNSTSEFPVDVNGRKTEQIPEDKVLETADRNLTKPGLGHSLALSNKASLGAVASLARKKRGLDNMDAIIFRRLSSILPSTSAPPVNVVSRNILACISSRLCASYRLVYRHACRHLERVASECQDRDPAAIRKQMIGTKRIMSLLVCKMEEMRSHVVPYCVDRFRTKAERRLFDCEQTTAIYTWLNELLEFKDGANPGRVCRVLHSILYTHLSRYDAFGAIQLVDKMVRIPEIKQLCCSPDANQDREDTNIGRKKTRNAEKRRNLENLKTDVLKFFWSAGSRAPLLSAGLSDKDGSSARSVARPMKLFLNLPSKRLFQTMGRFMARYFVWGCEPFIHPPHQPYSLPPLYENPEAVDEERRLLPIQRLLLTKAINLQQFGRVWSPVRALQYLLVSGLFQDAIWYLHNLGNVRAAVSVAAVVEYRKSIVKSERNVSKLSLAPCFQTQNLLKEMVQELVTGSLNSDSWIEDPSQLQSNFTSAFLASAICKVDVLMPVTRMMMMAMLGLITNKTPGKGGPEVLEWPVADEDKSRRHFFAHPLVDGDVKSPLPSVYYPQPAISTVDEARLSRTYLRELRARIFLQRIFSLVQVVFSAAGCLKLLVSSYSRLLVETSSKVGGFMPSELLKPFLDGSDPHDVSFSTSDLLSDFRDLCSLMWLMTLRDQLFMVFREKQKEEQVQIRRSDTAEDADWSTVCRDCVQSCMNMLPFSQLLGFSSQLNSLLLSSLFELPNDEETALTTARCFPRPEALDPDCRSRLQLKLKEWETAFASSRTNGGDGSTMAAYYFKHCNSDASDETEQSPSEQITFPNLTWLEKESTLRPVNRQENERRPGTSEAQMPQVYLEPRSFESKEDYIRFLVDFFEVLLTNNKTRNYLPLIPRNFHKIRRTEFASMDGKPNDDWVAYQEDDAKFNSKKSQRAVPSDTEAPLSGLLGSFGSKIGGKSVNEDQQTSLLNLAKFISNRPSKRFNDNKNSNNNTEGDGDVDENINDNNNNAGDDYEGDDVNENNENANVTLPSSQLSNNTSNNNLESSTISGGMPSELQTDIPSAESPTKPKVDFSNKPYLPEEPGSEIRFTSHCIQPLIFERMDFGSNYQETERLARWLCTWSDADRALDKRRILENVPPVTGGEDAAPRAAIKVFVQSKLLVYAVWSAERQEIYERIRTEVATVPVEMQVSEEELTEESRKVSEDLEIRDASTQSEGAPKIPRPLEKADNFNQMSDGEGKDYPQLLLDEVTQTEPVKEEQNKAISLDTLQLAVKEEMKRILEAQNHGILCVLEHLKSSSYDYQQELRDLLQVLQVPLQQPLTSQAPSPRRSPISGIPRDQYAVYAVTIETENQKGFSGNSPPPNEASAKMDQHGKEEGCQQKQFIDPPGIVFAESIADLKVENIEKESETEDNNLNNNTGNSGNNIIICKQNEDKDERPPSLKLPRLVDVISELKDLIGSHGSPSSKVGLKLLKLPLNRMSDHTANSSEQEEKFSKLISVLKSLQLDSVNGQAANRNHNHPIPSIQSTQPFSPNFRFPVKLSRSDNNDINNNNNNNNNNSTNSHQKKGSDNKSRRKESRASPTNTVLSEDFPLLKMQPHQQRKHLALIKASQATQKQLFHIQEQCAARASGPQKASLASSHLQKRQDRHCRKSGELLQEIDSDVLPCPCLPRPADSHVYDSIRKLVHRQVQEYEKRKQFERLQNETIFQARGSKTLELRRPSTDPLPKKEVEDYEYPRISTSSFPKTILKPSPEKVELNCQTLQVLKDQQNIPTPKKHSEPPPRPDLDATHEPFDVQPLRVTPQARRPPSHFGIDKPTNAQLQLLAATGVRSPCCLRSTPMTVPRTSAEDAKKQLERCQEKLEEAKEEIIMLKKALDQELHRIENQKDEPVVVENLNLESVPIEMEDIKEDDELMLSVMEAELEAQSIGPAENLLLENPSFEDQTFDVPVYEDLTFQEPKSEVPVFEEPIFETHVIKNSFPQQDHPVEDSKPLVTFVPGNCPSEDFVVQDGGGGPVAVRAKTPDRATNEIFFTPTVAAGRQHDLILAPIVTVDIREAVTMMRDAGIARHEAFITPAVATGEQRDMRMENMQARNYKEPRKEFYPDRPLHFVRSPEEPGVDLIMLPHSPHKQQQDEVLYSPQYECSPLTTFNREFRNDFTLHNNLSNYSDNHHKNGLNTNEEHFDEFQSEFPISPKCRRTLKYGFKAVTDMDANVKAIQDMAKSIEQDFNSARLIQKKPIAAPSKKQEVPKAAPKPIVAATCIKPPPANAPHFFIQKNLENLSEMVDSSIASTDKQEDCVSNDCHERPVTPRNGAYTGWMSEAQRAREEEKKRRIMKNIGERCKIAEDLIKGLTGTPNKPQSAKTRVTIPTFYCDRTSWIKKTEPKPHPRTTYVERLQKMSNPPRDRLVFFGCKKNWDRYKTKKPVKNQVQPKVNRPCHNFEDPVLSVAKKLALLAECESLKHLSHNNNTILGEPVTGLARKSVNFNDDNSFEGHHHGDALGQSEDSLELGAEYLDLIPDGPKSADSSTVSVIDWSQVEKTVKDEEVRNE